MSPRRVKTDTDLLHTQCKVDRLADRRQQQLAVLMYKQSKKLGLALDPNPRTRLDRKIKFPQQRHTLARYERSPYHRGVQLWNRIDVSVQTSNTVDIFKRKYGETPLGPELLG